MEFLVKLPWMGVPLSKTGRRSNGLDHQRSLLDDPIYAKVGEIDGKCFEKEGKKAKKTYKFSGTLPMG